VRLIAGLFLAAALACQQGTDPGGPRLVLLYAPCTVNADFLSAYNSDVSFTPNIDRFAKESVVFQRHHTEAGQSGIAFASILTGMQADGHGVYRHPVELRDEVLVIAEAYADAGYETFAWAAHVMASPLLGYTQGVPEAHTHDARLRANDPDFIAILDRLRSDPTYRAFIFTDFTVTHSPYRDNHLNRFLSKYGPEGSQVTPETKRLAALYHDNYLALSWNYHATIDRLALSQNDVDDLISTTEQLYASRVNHLDRLFGAVVGAVDERGLQDQSLVVFTTDHGELLYREDAPFKWSHAMQLAADAIRVPLLIRCPGVPVGRYEGVTRSIDLLPTMLALSNLRPPKEATLAGVDLSRAMAGDAPPPELLAYSHTSILVRSVFEHMYNDERAQDWEELREFFPSEDAGLMWASVRKGDWFYRLRGRAGEDWRVEAFDLARDPGQAEDLFDENNEDHTAIARSLAEYQSKLVRTYLEASDESLLSTEEELKVLRSLGYIK
jgi:arylsulfatase A-like enzyme